VGSLWSLYDFCGEVVDSKELVNGFWRVWRAGGAWAINRIKTRAVFTPWAGAADVDRWGMVAKEEGG
jgi:hypothetical protein